MNLHTFFRYYRVVAFASLAAIAVVSLSSAADTPKIGVINFKACFEGSKLGKQEQARFDEIKKQIETTIEAKEKELNDMAPKFSEEYLDTLSPEAEAELKTKFKTLSQDLSQQQNQYYNMLNQANYQIVHQVNDAISQAAKKVAQAKGLELAVNEEVCFYRSPSLDISKEIVLEMDSQFDKEAVKPTDKK